MSDNQEIKDDLKQILKDLLAIIKLNKSGSNPANNK